MHTVQIHLDSIDKVKAFVNSVNSFDGDFDLTSGHSIIDAKSIMGILSLDLSNPLNLTIYNDNTEVMEGIKPFIDE
jgi:phosphotransferase system HPr-like phosphotransfer protein